MNRLFLLILCGIGLTLTGCEDAMLVAGGATANAAETANNMHGPEARRWLRNNESESPLASNRFGSTENAVKFVNELYRAGAVEVLVPDEAIEADEFEVYADSLVVVLPQDPTKRRRVLGICGREAHREGFDLGEDDGSGRIFLWWD